MILQTSPLWVVGLCADWCGLCRDYRQVFEGVAATTTTACRTIQFVWLDIEEHADLVGDLDIETFPTVLIADAQGVYFLGALTPHAQTLSRLLLSLEAPAAARAAHSDLSKKLLDALPRLTKYWV